MLIFCPRCYRVTWTPGLCNHCLNETKPQPPKPTKEGR